MISYHTWILSDNEYDGTRVEEIAVSDIVAGLSIEKNSDKLRVGVLGHKKNIKDITIRMECTRRGNAHTETLDTLGGKGS